MSPRLSDKQYENTTCPHCEEKVEIIFNIEDIESSEVYPGRGMGAEIEHDFTSEVECPNCNKDFIIRGTVWEYPSDVVNNLELK